MSNVICRLPETPQQWQVGSLGTRTLRLVTSSSDSVGSASSSVERLHNVKWHTTISYSRSTRTNFWYRVHCILPHVLPLNLYAKLKEYHIVKTGMVHILSLKLIFALGECKERQSFSFKIPCSYTLISISNLCTITHTCSTCCNWEFAKSQNPKEYKIMYPPLRLHNVNTLLCILLEWCCTEMHT